MDVYVDFMTYIARHTRQQANLGHDPWQSEAEIVIPHPSEWGTPQHDFMVQAAVASGFTEDSKYGRSRVHFTEEPKACARFHISASNAPFVSQLMVRMLTLTYNRCVAYIC